MSRFPFAVTLLGVVLAASTVHAQLPTARLNSMFPAGAKQGATIDVTINGTDLELADKLLFTHPGITAVPKMRDPNQFEQGKQRIDNQFTLKVAGNVPPGLYEVRAVGKFGITNPRAFVVSGGNEILEKEGNNTPKEATDVPIGAIVNGQTNGGTDIDYFKITAKKGQRLILDCWASRIDSRLDPQLAVYDASGRELESDRDTNHRDPLIDFIAPADGEYFIKLRDAVYGGSVDYYYRLSVSAKPYIDYVIPPAGEPGKKGSFTLYGRNLPGGSDAGVSIDGKPLQKLTVQIDVPGGDAVRKLSPVMFLEPESASIDGFAYRFTGSNGTSNPVIIGFAAAPVVLEKEPNTADQPQKVSLPCEFVGQAQISRDKDYITFDAKGGDVFWCEFISQRQGVPLDATFVLQQVQTDKEGKKTYRDIASVDDSMGNFGGANFNTQCDDPSYRFAVPGDGTYRMLIRDLYNRGDPRYVYRLSIRKEQPDFRLAALPRFPGQNQNQTNMWSTLLRKGGADVLQLVCFRRDGFNGEVQISVEGLPPGVSYNPVTMGPNQSNANLVLTAADNAKDWAGMIRIVGKAKINGQDVTRQARGGAVVWPPVANNQGAPARVTNSIALAVTTKETAPFLVSIGDGKVTEMSRGGNITLPIKVTRRDNFKGNINMQARDVVSNIRVNNINLGNKSDGKLTITLPTNVTPGTYTFYMVCQSQIPYRRNLDLVEAAKKDKDRIDKLVKDLDAASKKAAADAQKAAKEAKAAAAKVAKEAADKLRAAQAYQRQVNQRFTNLNNAARQSNTNVYRPSTTFTIKVTEAPIQFPAEQKPAKVPQGAKIEVPVSIKRLYNFAEQVQLQTQLPRGVGGLSIPNANIAKGQAAGKIVIQAAANATPGTHTLTIRATARFNNQNLQITQTLPLTVEKVEPKKK